MDKVGLLSNAKPILFNTEMVRAILDGRKTETRRIVKPQPWCDKARDSLCPACAGEVSELCLWHDLTFPEATYKVGDILYVRETWCWCPCWDCGMDTEDGCCDETAKKFYNAKKFEWGCYGYKASFEKNEVPFDRWYPSIHMPREAARIYLRVTGVRKERLQDIITGDYKTPVNINAEGLYESCCKCTHVSGDCKDFIMHDDCMLVDSFIKLWNSTIKKKDFDRYSWDGNPWVWVFEFEKVMGVDE